MTSQNTRRLQAATLLLAGALPASAFAQDVAFAPVKALGIVTITGGRPTSLPTQIPTTIEGINAQQI